MSTVSYPNDPPKLIEGFSWQTEKGVWQTNEFAGTLSFIPKRDPKRFQVWGVDPEPDVITFSEESAKFKLGQLKIEKEKLEAKSAETKG